MSTSFFQIEEQWSFRILRMRSQDGTNRLTRCRVLALTAEINRLAHQPLPLALTGNDRFFSAGEELGEIGALEPTAYEFSKMGQALMREVECFPARYTRRFQDIAWAEGLIWLWLWLVVIALPLPRPCLDMVARRLS